MEGQKKESPIVGVRFAPAEIVKLDAYTDRARRSAPGARWTRSSAIRDLVLRALDLDTGSAA